MHTEDLIPKALRGFSDKLKHQASIVKFPSNFHHQIDSQKYYK